MHYPEPTFSVQPSETRLTTEELMDIHDKYSKLGLYIIPKLYGKKYPHSYFWATENRHLRRNREDILRHQHMNHVSGWCVVTGNHSDRVVVIDLDPQDIIKNGNDPEAVYHKIQALSKTGFVLSTPSNGLHMYYRVPSDKDMLTNAAPPIKGVDLRGEGGQVVFIGGYNRYEGEYAKAKGVPDGHTATYRTLGLGSYGEIPYLSDDLYLWLTSNHTADKATKVRAAHNYEQTEQGQARLAAHFKQPFDAQERIVAEALMAVLQGWDKYGAEREEWLQLYMAAHHGCGGSTKIRDIILLHPNVRWSDGEEGRQKFIQRWSAHSHKEGGYTVSSLFWLASQSGWMTTTGYEIPDERVRSINVQYIQEWSKTLDTVPPRLLLQSQTGSGKTFNIKWLWDKLDSPKTVIFVPTKKLATELAQTLRNEHGLPATLYRDIDSQDIIAPDELQNALILVTTLQTFSSKLSVDMADYGLVYIEESDQLIQQFARGGGGYDSSHVSDDQARKGYAVLRDAMEHSGVVWCVDATMSTVTLELAENMSHVDVEVVRNVHIANKAPVEILDKKEQAYQKVLEGLLLGRRVVVATDTAREAEVVAEIMQSIGALRGKKSLVITRHTENNKNVREFMRDVNRYAQDYALLCYNTVMGSGVSITSVEPDIIVQIASYLPPKVNLQLLNRYRHQKQVFLYYTPRENIYASHAEELHSDMDIRALLESRLTNMPVANRVPDAKLRAYIAAISLADTSRQFRSAKDFYIALLRQDGRAVTDLQGVVPTNRVLQSIKAVKEARKIKKDIVARTWVDVPPIDAQNPAKEGYTPLQVAQGEVHAMINNALLGNIPDACPEYIYEVVSHFAKFGFILTAFVNQELALRRTEAYLGDDGRSLGNLRSNIALIRLLSSLQHLYATVDEVISPETTLKRAGEFMSAITLARETYNTVIRRSNQKYEVIYQRYDDDAKRALAFSKILFAQVGLKQKNMRKRVDGVVERHHYVNNITDARTFLRWRNGCEEDVALSDDTLLQLVAGREQPYAEYRQLTKEAQDAILDKVDGNNSFEDLVALASGGETW